MADFYNDEISKLITGTSYADSVYNYFGKYCTISTGAGNDSVDNVYGDRCTINTGAGNDFYYGYDADYCKISTGAGNDSVYNYYSYYCTINTGAGNDLISLSSASYGDDSNSLQDVIVYKSGDGNDKVYGFDVDDTLSISGGSYSTTKSGSNVIVTVDDGKISLIGAASYFYSSNLVFKQTSTGKTLTSSGSYTSLVGGSGNDSLYIGHNGVTASGGAGNDTIYNDNGDDSSINAGDGDDSIYADDNDDVTVVAGAGNDTISGVYWNSTVSGGAGNDTISGDYWDSTVSGGAGNDNISIGAWSSTIDGGEGADTISAYAGSISGGAGNDSINIVYCDNTVKGGIGNDTISFSSYYYSDLVQYTSGDGNDKIYGFGDDDTLSISGGSYSTTKSGSNIIVTVGDGKISLMGAASLDNVNISGTQTETNSWKLDGSTATYGTASNTLIKLTNIKSLSGVSLSGNVVTISKAAVNAKKITLTGDGYTLALADDVTKRTTNPAAWSYSDGTATYKNSYKTAGYTLASNAKSITYSKAETPSTLATVKGVKSKSGLTVSGNVITVANSSVNAKKITLTGTGYTLKLADDVPTSTTKKAAWTKSGTTATYKSSYDTAGYKLASDSKSITYSGATTPTTLASVKGAASTSGLSVSGKKITLKKSALNSKVTIGGGYEFNFASDYKNATITGSAKADSITTNGTKLSVSGGAGNDTIKVLGSTTTVKGGNGADIFIFDGGSGVITDYKAEDKISVSGTADFTTSGDNVILTVGSKKITVKGGKNETITYSDKSGKNKTYREEQNDSEGVIISGDGKTVTITEDYYSSTQKFSVADYGPRLQTINASAAQMGLNITGNSVLMNNIIGTTDNDTIIGGNSADTIFGGDGNDTIIGGTGNDSLSGGKGADTFVWNKGDGDDVIYGYTDGDLLQIAGDTVRTVKASSGDLVFTMTSRASITVQGGADKVIEYVDGKGSHIHSQFVKFNADGTSATLKSNYPTRDFAPSNYSRYIDELATINASAVSQRMNIVGNGLANSIFGTADEDTIDGGANNDTIRGGNGNDSLIGGAGKDYLYGGEGNDTLWGGKGNDYLYGGEDEDVFIYKPGEDTDRIYNYEPGIDKIILLSGSVDNVSENANGDVVFTIGTGKIILDNGVGNYAEVLDSNGNILERHIPKTRS